MTALIETSTLASEEAIIRRGWDTYVEVGEAFMRIRDQHLYRELMVEDTFMGVTEVRPCRNFTEYLLKGPWAQSRGHAYRVMEAAETVLSLGNLSLNETAPTLAQASALTVIRKERGEEAAREAWSGRPSTAQLRTLAGATAPRVRPSTRKMLSPVALPLLRADVEGERYLLRSLWNMLAGELVTRLTNVRAVEMARALPVAQRQHAREVALVAVRQLAHLIEELQRLEGGDD